MNENFGKKNPPVDDAGIRLAPAPMDGNAQNTMPPVVQEFVVVPKLEYRDSESARGEEETVSTASDYQPTEKDAGRRWKRAVRTRNFVSGVIMLVATAVALLPFALAAADVSTDFLPFKFVPERFDVISGWIDAFKRTAALGWSGEEVKTIWLYMVPNMILTVGIIALVVNLVKSIIGLCGAIRPKRYTSGAVVFLLSVVAVFIAALVGAENVGLPQMDFMNDFIYGWNTSEFFTLFAVGLFDAICALICSFITPQRTGYTRVF